MRKHIFFFTFFILSFVVGCEKYTEASSVVITSGNHSYIPINRFVENNGGREMQTILDMITLFEKNNPKLIVTDWKLREEKVYSDTWTTLQYGIFIDHIKKGGGEN